MGSALLFLAIFSIQAEMFHVPLRIYRYVTFIESPVAQVVGSQVTMSFTHNESFYYFSNSSEHCPSSLPVTFIPGLLCSLSSSLSHFLNFLSFHLFS